jgi:hypothetical protein
MSQVTPYTLSGQSDQDVGILATFALEYCTEFLLVTRDHSHSVGAVEFLQRLKPWYISDEDLAAWPGTILLRGTAKVSRFKLDSESAKILITLNKPVSQWLEPDMPEDLAFLRADGTLFAATTSHESDVFLQLTIGELNRIQVMNPQFSSRLTAED